jgi:hypothetical protein
MKKLLTEWRKYLAEGPSDAGDVSFNEIDVLEKSAAGLEITQDMVDAHCIKPMIGGVPMAWTCEEMKQAKREQERGAITFNGKVLYKRVEWNATWPAKAEDKGNRDKQLVVLISKERGGMSAGTSWTPPGIEKEPPKQAAAWNWCKDKIDGTVVPSDIAIPTGAEKREYLCYGGRVIVDRGSELGKAGMAYNKARKEMQKEFGLIQKLFNENLFKLGKKELRDLGRLVEHALIAGFGDVKPDDIKNTFNPDHSGPSHVSWQPGQSLAEKKSKYQANYFKFKKKRSDLFLKVHKAIKEKYYPVPPRRNAEYQTLMKFLGSNSDALQAAYNFHIARMHY